MMTVEDMMKALRSAQDEYPMEAMQSALDRREAIAPELLRMLEDGCVMPPLAYEEKYGAASELGLYLLGHFREQAAFPLLLRMLSRPGDETDALIGETSTDGLDRILAATYDGQRGLLEALVENPAVDEFVRGAGVRAMVLLVQDGRIPRESMVAYFRALFGGKLERKPVWPWHELVFGLGDLPAPELLDEARLIHEEGLLEEWVDDLQELEDKLASPSPRPDATQGSTIDAIEATSWWACFDPEERRLREDDLASEATTASDGDGAWDDMPLLDGGADSPPSSWPGLDASKAFHPAERAVQPGRNDPCPCGSGKKFKKCCG